MKKLLAIVVIGVVLLLGRSGNVRAEEFGYVRYELDCGTVCYDFGEWGYCQDTCDEAVCAVPAATKTPTPTNTDAPEATPTDVPEVTPEATDVPKVRCDRGIGNGSEKCDPGNSSGQGRGDGRRAGEDRDEPKGNPRGGE